MPRLGLVFQHANLFDSRSIAGNVAYPLALAGAGRAEREAKASRARTPRHEKSFFEKLTENTMVRQMARSAAREITRSIFGTGRRR